MFRYGDLRWIFPPCPARLQAVPDAGDDDSEHCARMARYRRLIIAFVLIAGVNLALAGGYWVMNQGRTNQDGSEIGYLQCLYMTVVSTFTVGYGELVPVVTAADRVYTMLVIVLGLGSMGYALSQMTAFVVEGDLKEIIERR